jgi:hypothetical protein
MKIVEVKSKNGINFMILDGNNEPIVDAVLLTLSRYFKYLTASTIGSLLPSKIIKLVPFLDFTSTILLILLKLEMRLL